MGGIIPLSGVLIVSLLWNDLTNSFILIMYLTTIWLGGIGFVDDYYKNVLKSGKKIRNYYKYLWQIIPAFLIGIVLLSYKTEATPIPIIRKMIQKTEMPIKFLKVFIFTSSFVV